MKLKLGVVITVDKQCQLLFYAKILHHNFTPKIYKDFKSVFEVIQGKQKFGNLHVLFKQLNE